MSPVFPDGLTAADRAGRVQAAMPADGLFDGLRWRIGPRPFVLEPALVRELEGLGRVLLQFQRAASLLYRWSSEGRQPGWVSALLDQGKPAELVALQRDPAFRSELPRVIRPDLLLTDDGFVITELDSVPGGIGLTQWLNETYAGLGDPVLGGADGMRRGFEGIFGTATRVHLMVSEEAATYRPEMEWLADRLGRDRFGVVDGNFTGWAAGDAVYRFFELFDLPQVPASGPLFEAARRREVRLTPPPRPLFEEKLWLALLGNRNLTGYWREQLGDGFLRRLRPMVPRSWVLDPTPLPPHAAYPGLDLTDWRQLKLLSQRERDLVLKISGFSERAWGSRGVHLGSDLSGADWSAAVDGALRDWPDHPHVLQEYRKPRLVETTWVDPASGREVAMPGRVRLCPYYFVHGEGDAARTHLGGVLATINPADKKIIHGMGDAVLVPVVEASRDGIPGTAPGRSD